jgi:hypothetical protein
VWFDVGDGPSSALCGGSCTPPAQLEKSTGVVVLVLMPPHIRDPRGEAGNMNIRHFSGS